MSIGEFVTYDSMVWSEGQGTAGTCMRLSYNRQINLAP